jgi:hypothetical protein
MKRIIQIGVILTILSLASMSISGVITFDDIATDMGYGSITNPYKGFSWDTSFMVVDQGLLISNWAYANMAFPSGPNAISSTTGNFTFEITSTESFTFNAAEFMSWGNNYKFTNTSALYIVVEGWLDGNLVGKVELDEDNLSAAGFTHAEAGFSNINKVKIIASGQSGNDAYFLMDNFTYNEPVITPEPLTAPLFVISLLGLAGLRRRLG